MSADLEKLIPGTAVSRFSSIASLIPKSFHLLGVFFSTPNLSSIHTHAHTQALIHNFIFFLLPTTSSFHFITASLVQAPSHTREFLHGSPAGPMPPQGPSDLPGALRSYLVLSGNLL